MSLPLTGSAEEALKKAANFALLFSIITISAGITSSTSKVANANPKQSVMAIGTMYIAKLNDSNISGDKPAMVVNEVSITALKRLIDAS
tara:strand:+ start:1369 stop:1635 length:267 start_codon:yes stop_codon:yes gene_type:complete